MVFYQFGIICCIFPLVQWYWHMLMTIIMRFNCSYGKFYGFWCWLLWWIIAFSMFVTCFIHNIIGWFWHMVTTIRDSDYNDVIMSVMASQITSLTIVYSNVYSGADQRKHQRSASLAFVWGIHRGPVKSPHKGPVTRKCFHLMTSSCLRIPVVVVIVNDSISPVCYLSITSFHWFILTYNEGFGMFSCQNDKFGGFWFKWFWWIIRFYQFVSYLLHVLNG